MAFDSDGWSTWITPSPDKENYCAYLGEIILDAAKKDDFYSCQVEIEYKDVKATPGQRFWFRAQGPVDGTWNIRNVWDDTLVSINDVPEDGVFFYTSTIQLSEAMANAKTFILSFRCDYWSEGSFRVRKIQVEKGKTISKWVPGECQQN